jgi:hypothetical protein
VSQQSCEVEISDATRAVLVSLLRALLEKSILSNSDVRTILTKAAHGRHPHDYAAPAEGAAGIILNEILPKFAEDGGN